MEREEGRANGQRDGWLLGRGGDISDSLRHPPRAALFTAESVAQITSIVGVMRVYRPKKHVIVVVPLVLKDERLLLI